ncbi:hypothetical protein ACJ6WF_17235 [Streptomyces sp. MMS24-I2-30]|uniref:hypothetical protein n=1 Tax=Streptomyces sp. MMS24-I2-30 TaxID=3351564 RepID=UPI003896C995
MKKTYQFIDVDQDVAGAELIEDKDWGPVIWLQTTANGCYIPIDRLTEFVQGLHAVAEGKTPPAEPAA